MSSDAAQARDIFLSALDKEEGPERSAFLDAACLDQPELRHQVDVLLLAHQQTGHFLEVGALAPREDLERYATELSGTQVGPYKLLQKIGEGGMGVVYMAEQYQPVRRKVALKIITPGMDSRQIVARFEAERQALAMMDHPHIAKVLDVGATATGRPYFVMELVKGIPITSYCDERRLSLRERLQLFLTVCQAIQHAHQKGIIHRDIKPSNVLVALFDGQPVTKVIDFGVAKAIAYQLTEKTIFTEFGQVVGTLEYMSPEQAELNQLDIDTRSDIYSLGVLLYELLTGMTPLDRQRLRSAAFNEMLRLIREEEPLRPSIRLSSSESLPSIAANRGAEPARLSKLVRGELDWIVMKALEKERSRRYETANALATDLRHYLDDEPVAACPPSVGYRFQKFARRNKAAIATTTIVAGALVLGLLGTSWQAMRAEQARKAEAQQRDLAESRGREAEAQKVRAFQFRDKAIATLRAATGEDVQKLIGARKDLGDNERAYMQAIADRWREFAAQEGDDEQAKAIRGEGHHQLGAVWFMMGNFNDALLEYEKAKQLRQSLVAEFPSVPAHQSDFATTCHNLGLTFFAVGRLDDARSEYERALDQQAALPRQAVTPDHWQKAASTHNSLGIVLAAMGRQEDAHKEFRNARDILRRLVEDAPGSSKDVMLLAQVHSNWGNLHSDQNDRDKAQLEYEAAHDIINRLLTSSPNLLEARRLQARILNNLAIFYAEAGRTDDALRSWEQTHDIQQKLAEQYPAVTGYQLELADATSNLAKFHMSLDHGEFAFELLKAAAAIQRKLWEKSPTIPEYSRNLADTQHQLGILLQQIGHPDSARREFEQEMAIRKRLSEDYATDANALYEYAESCRGLGAFLTAGPEPTEARLLLDQAIDMLRRLADSHPGVADYRRSLARAYNNLGIVYFHLGQYDEAMAEYQKAVQIQEQFVRERPDDLESAAELGGTYVNEGQAGGAKGDFEASLARLAHAIDTLQTVYASNPGIPRAREFLRNAHMNRARVLEKLGRNDEAESSRKALIDLEPK